MQVALKWYTPTRKNNYDSEKVQKSMRKKNFSVYWSWEKSPKISWMDRRSSTRQLETISNFHFASFFFFFLLGFTPCNAEQPLQGKAWSYRKKKHKKIKAYRSSVWKEPTVKRCLFLLHIQVLHIFNLKLQSPGTIF